MSAREKLNGVYITACFIFAGLIGGSFGSSANGPASIDLGPSPRFDRVVEHNRFFGAVR